MSLLNQGNGVLVNGWMLRPDRVNVRVVVALVAALVACGGWDSARAFDFFGLWSWDESPPPVSPTAISYGVTVEVAGGDNGLKNAVQDASSLYKLRKDAPPDGDALARRAESDFGPIIDALWGAGYYDAAVTISIDRASLSILSTDIAGFARAAESLPQPTRPRLSSSTSIPGRCSAPLGPRARSAPARSFRRPNCRRGSSASSPETRRPRPDLRAAQARIVDYFRKQGRPLAKIASSPPSSITPPT